MSHVEYGPINYDWWFGAMDAVRDRMYRATAALEAAGIPYAIVGGNAVASWVARVDPSAVRNTQDVDILIHRDDLERIKVALEDAGFQHHVILDVHTFIDGNSGRARDAIHLLFAGEKVKPNYPVCSPEIGQCIVDDKTRIMPLEELVRMKLTSFRRKDQVHIEDMIEVGLIDEGWVSRYPPPLAARLRHIFDTFQQSDPPELQE